MRIQHNIMAMSAYRNYTNNVSAMKKNLEKLSSGYKINRAGDDAAGLAISEKMRAQITGLETAQKNAKDGISLVQTAEGALTEVHDMLNRMVELATMSANGTYDVDTDRAQLQKEMDQLRSEIDRIADSANFNGIKLLDGSMDASTTTTVGDPTNLSVSAIADGEYSAGGATAGVYTIDLKDMKFTLSAAATVTQGQITLGALKVGNQNLISGTVAATVAAGTQVGIDSFGLDATKVVSQITINNNKYDVEVVDGNKIKLTMTEPPASASDLPSGTDLTVDYAGGTSHKHNNGYDTAVHIERQAVAKSTPKLAQGEFDLTLANIKDGAKLTIGENTYVFKVGAKGSATAGTGETLINLSAYEAGTDELGQAAAKALSNVANGLFDVTNTEYDSTNKKINIHLTEKLSASGSNSVNYKTQWNLAGPTTTSATDGTWNENVKGDANSGVVKFAAATTTTATGTALTLQIGDTADDFNKLVVNIQDMHVKALGIDSETAKISIATQDDAAKAIDAIKAAINKVSDVRGTLGATQNRLDHTINNLSVMTENIQDAESTIRDVDIAEEMMAYTKNNILIQSAQAMLAQANQVPQGVLQLLQ